MFVKKADCFLAMYHDQGLPVLKYAAFGEGVNVTLGLPFVRTSVDHGTALDIAGTGRADPGSLVEALKLAIASHRPRKRFAQHFLHERGVLENPARGRAAKSDHFVEIGPGEGCSPRRSSRPPAGSRPSKSIAISLRGSSTSIPRWPYIAPMRSNSTSRACRLACASSAISPTTSPRRCFSTLRAMRSGYATSISCSSSKS